MKTKILLIAYYWPPGGGIAVRRWMGLANALSRRGVEVHVMTIDPSSAAYQQVDESLFDEIENYSYHDELVVKQNYSSSLIHEFSWAFTFLSLKLNISNRISADSMSLGPGLLKY